MKRKAKAATSRSKKINLALHPGSSGQPIAGVGPRAGLEFAKAYFPEAQHTIRISSAYFTLAGYKKGRNHIESVVQLQILVGREEGWHVRATVVEEILAGLGQCEEDLWEAVRELVDRMKQGKFIIRDAREMQSLFHCKFYICDDKLVWHGSANYSRRGLCESAEQVSVSRDTELIRMFTDWFDDTAKNAKDLLAELIKPLEDWLNLSKPFDVYLKTLSSLYNLANYDNAPGAYSPLYYQKSVIARALRQAEQYGGALIIAATGLGKTVMGAEAAMRLHAEGKINFTILLAPRGVRENWEQQLESRRINFKLFNIQTLFSKSSAESHHQISQLEKQLQRANQKTLIMIDEAHFYGNQLLEILKQRESLVYQRLIPAMEAGAKILLLTATPYGTTLLNLNSLLYLLPHRYYSPTCPDEQNPWKIQAIEELSRLPVITILGLPHVLKMARNRGDIDSEGRTFIQFSNDERRYLPKIQHHLVSYQLFLQEELQTAFEQRCFNQDKKIPQTLPDEDTEAIHKRGIDTVYNSSVLSWLSSPEDIANSIEQNLCTLGKTDLESNTESTNSDVSQQNLHKPGFGEGQSTPYNSTMKVSLEKRKSVLAPVLTQLRQGDCNDDKRLKLERIIENHCLLENGKVIVFVTRYLTALYLLSILRKRFGQRLSIGCTVESNDAGPCLKPEHQRAKELKCFSPRSHNYTTDQEHNLMICTDADGVGIDLQDADTVVNYDPPDGADQLFQRAGRVLRMTLDSQRVVHLYTLIPSIFNQESNISRIRKSICDKFNRIIRRHDKSRHILGSAVMSLEENSEITLEIDLDVEQLTRDSEIFGGIPGITADSMMAHITVLEEHQNYLEKLPEYSLSARTYFQAEHRVFVLLRHEGNYYPILFNLLNESIEKQDELEIFDLLACAAAEPTALTPTSRVEQSANQAAQAWCKLENIPVEQVSKICVLYLAPPGSQGIRSLVNGE